MKYYADTIAFLGQWGRFQQVVFFLLCASIMPNGFGAFTLVFLTDIPDHHCVVPDVNLSADWCKTIIPVKVKTEKEITIVFLSSLFCMRFLRIMKDIIRMIYPT